MRPIKTSSIDLLIIGMLFLTMGASSANRLSFSPTLDVSAEVIANGQNVTFSVKKGKHVIVERAHIDTEKTLKLLIDDYNFDGYPDFSVSHIDDGMGTYSVYQIYVYSPQEQKFKLLPPQCGDEFINITISKKDRSLTNVYFENNQFESCTTKY